MERVCVTCKGCGEEKIKNCLENSVATILCKNKITCNRCGIKDSVGNIKNELVSEKKDNRIKAIKQYMSVSHELKKEMMEAFSQPTLSLMEIKLKRVYDKIREDLKIKNVINAQIVKFSFDEKEKLEVDMSEFDTSDVVIITEFDVETDPDKTYLLRMDEKNDLYLQKVGETNE